MALDGTGRVEPLPPHHWLWTKGHASHADNNRCDWLAQTAARTLTSSFPDNAPHAPMRLGLGPDYIPPNPQGGLFDLVDAADDDENDPG
jgi:hypothetical protein